MIDKVQKIRKEIEKLKSQLSRGACSSQVAMETRCKEEAYNEVLALLDTMQEEPVSEELIDVAKQYVKEHVIGIDKITFSIATDMFISGVNWKEQQMMSMAIDAELCSDGMFTPLISVNDKEKISDIKFGDKVKVVLLKNKEL